MGSCIIRRWTSNSSKPSVGSSFLNFTFMFFRDVAVRSRSLFVNRATNHLSNISEVIDNPRANLLEGARGYRQPSRKFLSWYRKFLQMAHICLRFPNTLSSYDGGYWLSSRTVGREYWLRLVTELRLFPIALKNCLILKQKSKKQLLISYPSVVLLLLRLFLITSSSSQSCDTVLFRKYFWSDHCRFPPQSFTQGWLEICSSGLLDLSKAKEKQVFALYPHVSPTA